MREIDLSQPGVAEAVCFAAAYMVVILGAIVLLAAEGIQTRRERKRTIVITNPKNTEEKWQKF